MFDVLYCRLSLNFFAFPRFFKLQVRLFVLFPIYAYSFALMNSTSLMERKVLYMYGAAPQMSLLQMIEIPPL